MSAPPLFPRMHARRRNSELSQSNVGPRSSIIDKILERTISYRGYHGRRIGKIYTHTILIELYRSHNRRAIKVDIYAADMSLLH